MLWAFRHYEFHLACRREGPTTSKSPQKIEEKGRTAGLLLRLCESIMHSGRVVIMDSGFCVLQALTELFLVGIYSSAVIKKRRYWPKYIDGEGIDQQFQTEKVGQCDSLPGTLSGKAFSIFCMKEENYTMKLMDTYGALVKIDGSKTLRLLTAVS